MLSSQHHHVCLFSRVSCFVECCETTKANVSDRIKSCQSDVLGCHSARHHHPEVFKYKLGLQSTVLGSAAALWGHNHQPSHKNLPKSAWRAQPENERRHFMELMLNMEIIAHEFLMFPGKLHLWSPDPAHANHMQHQADWKRKKIILAVPDVTRVQEAARDPTGWTSCRLIYETARNAPINPFSLSWSCTHVHSQSRLRRFHI